jgi:uncharacterized protein (DUF1330 family)
MAPKDKGVVMKAFVIATETVKDEAMFGKYREQVLKTLEPFDGRFSSAAASSPCWKASGPIRGW